jgi:quercetin dioxygenase-like cupin family protein
MTYQAMRSDGGEPPILVPAIGLDLFIRVPPGATGGAMSVIETVNAPGFGPPLHRHRETEIFRVLEGRYLYEVDGVRTEAGVGDVMVVPGGAAHAFRNITDAPARQFIVITPALDAEGFFNGLAEITSSGKPDREALNAFGARWHVEFLGPPLAA